MLQFFLFYFKGNKQQCPFFGTFICIWDFSIQVFTFLSVYFSTCLHFEFRIVPLTHSEKAKCTIKVGQLTLYGLPLERRQSATAKAI